MSIVRGVLIESEEQLEELFRIVTVLALHLDFAVKVSVLFGGIALVNYLGEKLKFFEGTYWSIYYACICLVLIIREYRHPWPVYNEYLAYISFELYFYWLRVVKPKRDFASFDIEFFEFFSWYEPVASFLTFFIVIFFFTLCWTNYIVFLIWANIFFKSVSTLKQAWCLCITILALWWNQIFWYLWYQISKKVIRLRAVPALSLIPTLRKISDWLFIFFATVIVITYICLSIYLFNAFTVAYVGGECHTLYYSISSAIVKFFKLFRVKLWTIKIWPGASNFTFGILLYLHLDIDTIIIAYQYTTGHHLSIFIEGNIVYDTISYTVLRDTVGISTEGNISIYRPFKVCWSLSSIVVCLSIPYILCKALRNLDLLTSIKLWIFLFLFSISILIYFFLILF